MLDRLKLVDISYASIVIVIFFVFWKFSLKHWVVSAVLF